MSSKFPAYPRHQTYNGGDERVSRHVAYPDKRYSSQRIVMEQPNSQESVLQNFVRNVAATSYVPQGGPPAQPSAYFDLPRERQLQYSDRRGREQHQDRPLALPPPQPQPSRSLVRAGYAPPPTMALAAQQDPLCFPRDGLVFMRFYDDKCHCSSCGTLGACFEQLSMRYRQANFFDANINANGRALVLLKIDSLPTVIAFRDRREIGRYSDTELTKLERFVHEMAHKL